MVAEPVSLRIHRFLEGPGLDPITMFVEQFSPSSSRVTVQCHARAWTAYWGAHGSNSVEDFIRDCAGGAHYIADNLEWGLNGLRLKRHIASERAYLLRIVEAIRAGLAKKETGDVVN